MVDYYFTPRSIALEARNDRRVKTNSEIPDLLHGNRFSQLNNAFLCIKLEHEIRYFSDVTLKLPIWCIVKTVWSFRSSSIGANRFQYHLMYCRLWRTKQCFTILKQYFTIQEGSKPVVKHSSMRLSKTYFCFMVVDCVSIETCC